MSIVLYYLWKVILPRQRHPVTETPWTETPWIETPGQRHPVTEIPWIETPWIETPWIETPWIEKHLWKHYLRKLRLRLVINAKKFWFPTWPRIWLQLTSIARPWCETPQSSIHFDINTIYWYDPLALNLVCQLRVFRLGDKWPIVVQRIIWGKNIISSKCMWKCKTIWNDMQHNVAGRCG